ncbi:TLC domain-containing protein 2-like isoform X2 [Panulirus ornatus]|uniref:TLC domain-containing protein 2-like isoform X2 n=1 Tax=Panulirus ornatus TaxID=150431 RepID=UPI003A87477A
MSLNIPRCTTPSIFQTWRITSCSWSSQVSWFLAGFPPDKVTSLKRQKKRKKKINFYEHPKLAEDLINTYTSSSHMLVSFSVGYFIHDFLDMAFCHRKRSSYELMVHHACVISCFGLAVWSTMFLGYAVVALFVEVNSVFLHIRQLFIIMGVSKKEPKYRLNSMLNIGTFVIFRIAVLGWMTRWIVIHKDDLSLPVYTLGSVGLAIIMLMNIVLFFRICLMDFTKKKHKESNKGPTHKNKIQDTEDVSTGGSAVSKTSPTSSLLPGATNLHLD